MQRHALLGPSAADTITWRCQLSTSAVHDLSDIQAVIATRRLYCILAFSAAPLPLSAAATTIQLAMATLAWTAESNRCSCPLLRTWNTERRIVIDADLHWLAAMQCMSVIFGVSTHHWYRCLILKRTIYARGKIKTHLKVETRVYTDWKFSFNTSYTIHEPWSIQSLYLDQRSLAPLAAVGRSFTTLLYTCLAHESRVVRNPFYRLLLFSNI